MHVDGRDGTKQDGDDGERCHPGVGAGDERGAGRKGTGIACLARYLGDGASGLVRLDVSASTLPVQLRDLWMGVHGDMRHTPRIRAFITVLQEGLKHAAGRLHPAA